MSQLLSVCKAGACRGCSKVWYGRTKGIWCICNPPNGSLPSKNPEIGDRMWPEIQTAKQQSALQPMLTTQYKAAWTY